jgi:hypothetical protein
VLGELLAEFGLDVVPLLCIHGVEFSWGKTAAQGVRIVGPRGLRKALESTEARLNIQQIQQLVDRAEATLKPA